MAEARFGQQLQGLRARLLGSNRTLSPAASFAEFYIQRQGHFMTGRKELAHAPCHSRMACVFAGQHFILEQVFTRAGAAALLGVDKAAANTVPWHEF